MIALLALAAPAPSSAIDLELIGIWQGAPEPCQQVASLDLDGDGADELLCSGATAIWLWAGSWQSTGNSIAWDWITIGDHDGDGLEDAVIGVQGGYPIIIRQADPPVPPPTPTGLSVVCGGIVQLHFDAGPPGTWTAVQVDIDGAVTTHSTGGTLYYAGGSGWYVADPATPDAATWRVRVVGGDWSAFHVYGC
jgi:hypothetical protein